MVMSPASLEAWLKPYWEHSVTSWVLGLIAAITAICFLHRSPVPGVSIAVLGVVAAVMSIRTLSTFEKFGWMLIVFALLYAEIRAIRVDRTEANKHALEDRQDQYSNFLTLSRQQQSLATNLGGLQNSLEKQFANNTIPVQIIGKGGKPKQVAVPPAAASPSQATVPPSNPAPSPVSPAHSGSLTITQQDDVSTRTDAPNKIKVTIQTTVDMPTLKLALKCNVPIVQAQGGPAGAGLLIGTNQGIANADPTVWFFHYGSAVPPFGPSNPIVVNVWTATPAVCNQAATF